MISPKSADDYLHIPLHSSQTIECINQNPTVPIDIIWRYVDAVCKIFFIGLHLQTNKNTIE